MTPRFIITEYIDRALAQAEYDKLEDATFVGTIPNCPGVIAFGTSLRDCELTLRSTLEDWLLLGFKLDHLLPVIDGIDLNGIPEYAVANDAARS